MHVFYIFMHIFCIIMHPYYIIYSPVRFLPLIGVMSGTHYRSAGISRLLHLWYFHLRSKPWSERKKRDQLFS